MFKSVRAKFYRTLHQNPELLPPSIRMLLAISGGQDSQCMLHLCVAAQKRWQWKLAIAHCDHRWRADSTANAEFVAKQSADLGIPFHLATAKEIPSSESKAREWRYEALTVIAQKHQFSHVVTGHTLSDQAETVLYNLIRGSGAEGLSGIALQRWLTDSVKLVRPLLKVSRDETGQFCQERDIPVWWDHTNEDLNYRRNHLRSQVMPYLKDHFNLQAEVAIAQTAELLAAESEYLTAEAQRVFESMVDRNLPCALKQSAVQALPLALQRRVLRHFLQLHTGGGGNFDQVECMRAILPYSTGRTSLLAKGVWAEVQGDHLLMIKEGMIDGGVPQLDP
ncbi:MAG: tRNA lysidine(34) synthetase TilS [Oscillatoriales cyanobacterium SM2_2_1]|nr:tRNA lysidine(34) synthetase TilS [Oscillatoriales cyanobacterium SM2_2_1]